MPGRRNAAYDMDGGIGDGEAQPQARTTGKVVKKKTKKRTKRQIHVEAHTPDRLNQTTSSYVEAMIGRAQRETGDLTISTLKDAGGLIIGIQCPSLAFEYLICNNVLPLEKVVQIYGYRGIGKSGLAFDIMRMFRRASGIGTLLEHETKFNEQWASSIIGWDDADCMGVIPCDSIDDWQEHLQKSVAHVKQIMTGNAQQLGSGRIFPFLAIIDSIMGKTTRETQETIRSTGHAGRGFPIEALSITRFIQSFSGQLRRWPFMLICVNHLKSKGGDSGPPVETRSGGQTIDFQGSFEFKIKRIGRIRSANVDGNKLTIQAEKNSYGEDNRKIWVNCIWYDKEYDDPNHGLVRRQITKFDWHGATVQLILQMAKDKPSAMWTEAKDITGLVMDSPTKAHSKKLGAPKKEEGADYHTLGVRIAKDAGMMRDLRNLFGVTRRKVFRNDIDYLEQLTDSKKDIVAGKSKG